MVAPIVIGLHPARREPEPLQLGVMLARLTRAPLHLVGTFWFDTSPHRTAPEHYRQTLTDAAIAALGQAPGGLESAFDSAHVHVASGSAAHALQRTASEVGAALIVVGSTHKGAIGHIAMGSTADRVLDGAPCPVGVAPTGFRDPEAPPQRIGVAFVETPGGWSALRAGAAMARKTGAMLVAYTVTEPHAPAHDRELAQEAIRRALADVAPDLPAEARMLSERGIDALVGESRELDVLIRGCRTPGPVRPPLALEVPSKLARKVACPFIIVPPGLDDRFTALFDARLGADPRPPVPA